MNPNTFLKSLWRPEVLDQVFVAMSFDSRFDSRFSNVIRPAIEEFPIAGHALSAYRVDNSKSGDSILTDMVDGIAHSRLVLADVSVIDEGRYTNAPIRNGNVMYEVGLALACRTPAEVLLIRDDSKRFLFDVSTIPHMQIDFSEEEAAALSLREALEDRLRESDLLKDARIKLVAQKLTQDEIRILRFLSNLEENQANDLAHSKLGMLSNPDQRGIDGLLRIGCAESVAIEAESDRVFYGLTLFGQALARHVEKSLPKVPTSMVQDSEKG